MKFSERLIDLRREKGYNQNYLAVYMGVSQVSISNWERGFKEPNFQSLIDLANLFGVSCDYLLEWKMSVKKSKIIIFAVLLVVILTTLVGCTTLPSDDKKLTKVAVENWYNAKNKEVIDTYKLTDLSISGKMGLSSNVNLAIISCTIKITRTFNNGSSSLKIEVDGISLYLNSLVVAELKKNGIAVNPDKANLVTMKMSIELKGEEIIFNVITTNLGKLINGKEDINTNQVHKVVDNNELAMLMTNSMDIMSTGVVTSGGEYDKKEQKYSYNIPAGNVYSELIKPIKVIFEANKNLVIDGMTGTLQEILQEIFGTSNLDSIVNKFFTAKETTIDTNIIKQGNIYYFDNISTSLHINGWIKKDDAIKIFDYFGIDKSLFNTFFKEGIAITTNNSNGFKINSIYNIIQE